MKKMFITTAICGLSIVGTHAATTNTIDAARIVVTATRNQDDVRTVPANPSVITSQDLQDGHYSSVPEALQKKAGVFVSNTSDNPSQAAVNLRGFSGDNPHGKTLVLLNGRKLNRPDMATINWAQIPMQAVERIEVIRGPNSVLYGNHAVGGVINIITKESSDVPQTTLSASIASHETYEQSLTTSGNLKGLGYVATLGHQSGDGYRDRSAYDTISSSLRLSGQLSDQTKAYIEISSVKEQHQLTGALSAAQIAQNRRQAANPNDAAREQTINLQAGTETLLSDELILNLDAGYSTKDIEADFPSYFTPSYTDRQIHTYTLSPKFTFLAPLGGMDNELVIGIDLMREELGIKEYGDKGRTALSTDTEITSETIGGYIANTLSLTDKLLFSGGFRLEENKNRATKTGGFSPYYGSDTHTEEAWQITLTWLPTDSLKLFAGVDRTYRYPFVDEQAPVWGTFVEGLKPETGINYEIGIEYLPASNLVLQATAFRTDMKDEIAPNAFWVNENLDETTHRGVELSAAYTHELFSIDAYYTWLQSEFTDGANNGNEIPWVPQNQLDLNFALFLTDDLTLNTHMSYMGSMFQSGDNANSGANKQSEYAIFDLLLQYELPTDKVKATLFAGIDNLFGTEYNYLVYFGGYYPAPERTFKAGVSITF